MPKSAKKSKKSLKSRKSTKRQDIILAIILGFAVTGVGLIVTRYSSASDASFRRDPVKQMQGGELKRKTLNTLVRVASSPAPGINPVYTFVSRAEMENTARVCVQYTVLKTGTWINMNYINASKQGLSTSAGETKNPGTYVHCMARGDQAVDGVININVTPGAAEINKFYGVLRAYDD